MSHTAPSGQDLPKSGGERKAQQAFEAHRALMLAELLRDRALGDNPFWTMLRQDAYERFMIAFETIEESP